MIGEALKKAPTIFDISKVELVFNIALIYAVTYFFGAIPAIVGSYHTVTIFLGIGFSLIIIMAIVLKVSNKILWPCIIWFISGVFFTFSSALLNSGEASLITYAFAMTNVTVSFLILPAILRKVALLYYVSFLTLTTSVSLGLLPKLELAMDMTREHEFFDQPNIYAVLIAALMLAFVIESYIRTHQTANKDVLLQKQKVIEQKKLLETKNDTIKLSISMAAKLQQDSLMKLPILKSNFPTNFYVYLAKEELSGEFLWEKQIGNSVYFALVDTGEVNVPGAMYSFLVKNGLEKSFREVEKMNIKILLQYINDFMSNTVESNSGLQSNIKISLCEYNTATKVLHLVGVSNPVIIEQNNSLKAYYPNNNDLKYLNDSSEFDELIIQLFTGDKIYLCTDGVSNDEGQADHKEYSSFLKLLTDLKELNFEDQGRQLQSFYEDLKAKGEQRDDISVVGFKI